MSTFTTQLRDAVAKTNTALANGDNAAAQASATLAAALSIARLADSIERAAHK